jgi:hypothetical protein
MRLLKNLSDMCKIALYAEQDDSLPNALPVRSGQHVGLRECLGMHDASTGALAMSAMNHPVLQRQVL